MVVIVDDFRGIDGKWVKSFGTSPRQVLTKSGLKWKSMRDRCKVGGAHQKNQNTYIGCMMSDAFKDFQYFTDWSTAQVGYGISGYHLDKELLVPRNKLYSEFSCVFIPAALNTFLTSNTASRGYWPQGVNKDKKTGKFKVKISISGKPKHLGYYETPSAGFAVYKAAKEAEAYRWYERLKAGEFVVDERVVERMRTWTLEDEN